MTHPRRLTKGAGGTSRATTRARQAIVREPFPRLPQREPTTPRLSEKLHTRALEALMDWPFTRSLSDYPSQRRPQVRTVLVDLEKAERAVVHGPNTQVRHEAAQAVSLAKRRLSWLMGALPGAYPER